MSMSLSLFEVVRDYTVSYVGVLYLSVHSGWSILGSRTILQWKRNQQMWWTAKKKLEALCLIDYALLLGMMISYRRSLLNLQFNSKHSFNQRMYLKKYWLMIDGVL